VFYSTIDGSAQVASNDYADTSGSLVFPATTSGSTDLSFNIPIVGDNVVEDDETFQVEITSISGTLSSEVSIADGIDTLTLNNDDSATIALTTAQTSRVEGDVLNSQVFNLTLSGTVDDDFIVFYETQDGTALAGSDYTAVSGNFVFDHSGPAIQSFSVDILGDTFLEPNENFSVEITATNNSDISINGSSDSVDITLINDDSVSVSLVADTPSLNEDDAPGGDISYTATLSHVVNEIVQVTYTTVDGSASSSSGVTPADFTPTSGTLTFQPGELQKSFSVTINDDDIVEPTETLFARLSGVSSVAGTLDFNPSLVATVLVNDDTATLSLSSVDPDFASSSRPEGNTNNTHTFTVTLNGRVQDSFDVDYSFISGTAVPQPQVGADYTNSPGSVTFAAGAGVVASTSTETFDVAIVGDTTPEFDDVFSASITDPLIDGISIVLGAASADVILEDDDGPTEVRIEAAVANASEPNNNGRFTVILSNSMSEDVQVNLQVLTLANNATEGEDYEVLPTSVLIPANNTTIDIDVTVIDDSAIENDEQVGLSLVSTNQVGFVVVDASNNAATVVITDDDTTSASIVSSLDAQENGAVAGQFTVSLTERPTVDVVLNYNVTGTATPGTDYTGLSGSVTILATDPDLSVPINIIPVNDGLVEFDETVIVTLSGTSATSVILDTSNVSATVPIIDNDTATLSISAVSPGVNIAELLEDSTAGAHQFEVSLTGSVQDAFTLNYTLVGNTAEEGSDYTNPAAASRRIDFALGSVNTEETFDVVIIDDATPEFDETFTAFISAEGTFPAGLSITNASAEATILNDDGASDVRIVVNDGTASELGNDGNFRVHLDNALSSDVTINYSVSGTATNGAGGDYANLSGQVTIVAGQTFANIPLVIQNDSLIEGNETVILVPLILTKTRTIMLPVLVYVIMILPVRLLQ